MIFQAKNSSRRTGQTLIGLLVVVAIILAAAGFYLSAKGKNPDGSTSSKTALRRSVDLAQEVALQSNLGQIQQIIMMYKNDNNERPPASYDELKSYAKFPAEMWINPVDDKPLDYNPETGTMIVVPYEGMSPAIARATANPLHGADTPNTPGSSSTPRIPSMPSLGTLDDAQ